MGRTSDEAAAKVKIAYRAYLQSANPGTSNKASSYVRALDLLGEMLHAQPYGFEDCRDLWRVESLQRLQELHARAAEEKSKGDASAWNVEGIAPSYLRDGFCSAALRSYQEFLVEYRHEKKLLAVFEDHQGDEEELPRKFDQDLNYPDYLLEGLGKQEGRDIVRSVRTRANQQAFRTVVFQIYRQTCCITAEQRCQTLAARENFIGSPRAEEFRPKVDGLPAFEEIVLPARAEILKKRCVVGDPGVRHAQRPTACFRLEMRALTKKLLGKMEFSRCSTSGSSPLFRRAASDRREARLTASRDLRSTLSDSFILMESPRRRSLSIGPGSLSVLPTPKGRLLQWGSKTPDSSQGSATYVTRSSSSHLQIYSAFHVQRLLSLHPTREASCSPRGQPLRHEPLPARHRLHQMQLCFLKLPDPQFAIRRVERRVRHGGHHIPADTIRRRYARGWNNLQNGYHERVDEWAIYDASQNPPILIATGDNRPPQTVMQDSSPYHTPSTKSQPVEPLDDPDFIGADAALKRASAKAIAAGLEPIVAGDPPKQTKIP